VVSDPRHNSQQLPQKQLLQSMQHTPCARRAVTLLQLQKQQQQQQQQHQKQKQQQSTLPLRWWKLEGLRLSGGSFAIVKLSQVDS